MTGISRTIEIVNSVAPHRMSRNPEKRRRLDSASALLKEIFVLICDSFSNVSFQITFFSNIKWLC